VKNVISMADFIKSKENMKNSNNDYKVIVDGKLILQLQAFLDSFEVVFGDADWETTRCNLQDDVNLISPTGTFLNPSVDDESNNWHNRGNFLAVYRGLKEMLNEQKFTIGKISPCPHQHDDPDKT